MSLSGEQPEHGGRVTLRLLTIDDCAHFEALLLTAEARFEGQAKVSVETGDVELDSLDSAPEWMVTLTRSLLRGAWRARESAGWPRRITRWREAPQRQESG